MTEFTRYAFPPPSRNLERAAFFIAGQAFVARSESFCVTRAVVVNDGREAWIDVEHPKLPAIGPLRGGDAINARSIIHASLAGLAAQDAWGFGRYCRRFTFCNKTDFTTPAIWRAISLAGRIDTDGPPVLPPLWQEVQECLFTDQNWAAVTAVAETLIRDGELIGAEIGEIVKAAISRASEC